MFYVQVFNASVKFIAMLRATVASFRGDGESFIVAPLTSCHRARCLKFKTLNRIIIAYKHNVPEITLCFFPFLPLLPDELPVPVPNEFVMSCEMNGFSIPQ